MKETIQLFERKKKKKKRYKCLHSRKKINKTTKNDDCKK